MDKLQEFWYCVAPQDEIPLYRGETLDDQVVASLLAFLNYYRSHREGTFSEPLQKALLHNPKFIRDIRLLLGISDKRFYLDMTYLAHSWQADDGTRLVEEAREDLVKHSTGWFVGRLSRPGKEKWAELIAGYFRDNDLEQILNAFLPLSENLIKEIFNNLIAPKEIQQKQAKYRGHGAERLVARSFYDVGARIYPEKKHLEPMAERDPNVNLATMELVSHEAAAAGIHSFDLIIKDEEGDIRALVQGMRDMRDTLLAAPAEENPALRYACLRRLLLEHGYRLEMLSFFEPRLDYFAKWWIQLFAESEGKEGTALYPVAASNSEDLHSIGQFIQEGSPILFETFVEVRARDASVLLPPEAKKDYFDYLTGKDFWDINNTARQATMRAHSDRGIPCMNLSIPAIDAHTLGGLFYFFLFACYLSCKLLGVNPFNQPGVEGYKGYMFQNLGKPGVN